MTNILPLVDFQAERIDALEGRVQQLYAVCVKKFSAGGEVLAVDGDSVI